MTTSFVTGSTGLLGNHLVRELLACGHHVRALVRDVPRAQSLLPVHTRLTLVKGDLEDVAGFADALSGVDILFHAGAYFRDSYKGGSHWEKLRAVNVDGTRAVIEAAYERGVRRVLHVSSIGTLVPFRKDGKPVDETLRNSPELTPNDYYRSKILADRVVEDALEDHPDLWAAFILPGYMNGPGDSGPTAAGQTVIDYVAGRLPGVVHAHFSFVDARDVAKACVTATERAARGERFIVGGRRQSIADEYQVLEKVTGIKAPTMRMPLFVLGIFAAIQEVWARLTGKPVLVSMAMYSMLKADGPYGSYDSARAARWLGVTFRPLEETLRDSVEWLRARGMLETGTPRTASPAGKSQAPAAGPMQRRTLSRA